MAKIRHISSHKEYPSMVKIFFGIGKELVKRRQARGQYIKKEGQQAKETNRDIKYCATWFLLRSLTQSCKLQNWTNQKTHLLTWLQMNENTFRRQLTELGKIGLLEVDPITRDIILTSYEKAAEIMGLEHSYTYSIEYNYEKFKGKQNFQFLLTAEEFKDNQDSQLSALLHKLDENPKLRSDIIFLLTKLGCDNSRLYADPGYFQERLLELQKKYFNEGSDLLAYIYTFRADINRGVKCIARQHGYKSPQSVSYLKRRMVSANVITVRKLVIKSPSRARLYIPDEETGGKREGYKWLRRDKCTALVLCDQVRANYHTDIPKTVEKNMRKVA